MEIFTRTKYKDKSGERIYFKKPYFDKAFRRTFRSAEEKYQFMKTHNAVSIGDSDAKVKRERKEAYEKKMDTRRE